MNKKDLSKSTMRIDIPPDELDEPGSPKVNKGARSRRRSRSDSARRIILKKDEPALSRYSTLLNGIYDAVLITDRAGTILDINSRALGLFDYDRDELIRLNIADVVSGANDSLVEIILSNLDSHRYTLIDGYCRRSDGFVFPAEIAVGRMYLSKAGELCFLVRDVTKRQEIEQQLRQANKTKSLHVLAGGVAHDFNNLLTSVIGNTELALSMLSERSRAREDLHVALADAKKMAELSHRMLAYAGEGLLKKKKIDLNTLAAEALRDLADRIPPHIEVFTRLAPEPVLVGGETDILAVMIKSLLRNALEAIGMQHGSVTVESSVTNLTADFLEAQSIEADVQPGHHACLKVRDTGYGMDEVIVGKVFDPFFSTKGAGRGLGLSEAQGIVLAHGGAISVESSIGRGSTFTVWIPAFKEPAERRPAANEAAPGISGAVILVVDDEPSIRRYSARILKRYGASTILATDGPEGVDQFRAHADEIDLVLLDMFMPKMNGDKVFKAIRKIRPNVKVLVTSGYTESVYLDKFDKEQPSGFLYKPFATADFLKTIRATLAT